MERLEQANRKKAKKANLKKVVLATIAVTGMLGVAAVAPNALGAMAKLGLLPLKRQKEFIDRARNRLIMQSLLVNENGFLRLTRAGERELRKLQIKDYALVKPRRWDGKWRVLIFDIPEKRKGLREQIRRTLVMIGFMRLQDSVWLYPYDCEELVILLKADLRVGKDMRYLIVDSLEYDTSFRKHFCLIR